VAALLTVTLTAAGCATRASQPTGGPPAGALAGPQASIARPVPTPLAPITAYRNAVSLAVADGLRVWIETDLVKRWEEGPTWFHRAVQRVAELADQPGVVGIKVADELGYQDGMTSASRIRRFLAATASALHQAAPGKQILVDMVVPELGCLPGHQPTGSGPAACAARAAKEYPQLSLAAISGYLRMRVISVLDLSTYLQTDQTYASWGTTGDAAQDDAWRQVRSLGWPALVHLQARKALAHAGAFDGTPQEAAAELTEFVDIPLHNGAHAVDIWTWHQEYDGQMFSLLNPGMQPNALWTQLSQLHHEGWVLFTHMSPSSVESGLSSDLSEIATVFTDIFLPAGTG
jgi:hypothetical protein